MSKTLVVTGSARSNSVNAKVVEAVKADLVAREGVETQVADLVALGLPFVDSPVPPSADDYVIAHESVQAWSDMVKAADALVFVVPEYNHALSGLQKNALDWLYHEWTDKPAAFVGYGWYAAAHSHAQFVEINSVLKLQLGETFTGLQFMQDINPDGSLANEGGVKAKIAATIDELMESLTD